MAAVDDLPGEIDANAGMTSLRRTFIVLSDRLSLNMTMRTQVHLRLALASLALVLATVPALARSDDYARARQQMLRDIEKHARDIRPLLGGGGIAQNVMEVLGRTERHLFVPKGRRTEGYEDRPVNIGHGQTISQPFIVALMTHLLQPEADDVVLEIGTGSGYQAAILSPLVRTVCTIEIIPELGNTATERLSELGFANVTTRIADGYHGWPECGPFDGIVVTAAIDHVPPPLVRQLKPGGRMVIPLGSSYAVQALTVVEKSEAGEVRSRQIIPVRFVPFTRSRR